jgi:hypothetical protein
MVEDHPHRPLTQLVGILPPMLMMLIRHGSILSKSGASTKPGAIQCSLLVWPFLGIEERTCRLSLRGDRRELAALAVVGIR